jgi:hypothetical protein
VVDLTFLTLLFMKNTRQNFPDIFPERASKHDAFNSLLRLNPSSGSTSLGAGKVSLVRRGSFQLLFWLPNVLTRMGVIL